MAKKLAALVAAAFAAALLAAAPDSVASPGTTTRVSVASDGAQANGHSSSPAVSADGRYIAFDSQASTLVSGDTNNFCNSDGGEGGSENCRDVFVHDRQTGFTTRASVNSDGAQANGSNYLGGISDDGRLVSFYSLASNLVSGDTNTCIFFGGPIGPSCADVFVHDRISGLTERVSVDSAGTQANSRSTGGAISGNGRFVAFGSFASNLVPDDTNNCGFGSPGSCPDGFVHDRITGATTRVTVATGGAQGNGLSGVDGISADGRFVAFSSSASNLVPNDNNALPDIFVHDRQSGTTDRASVGIGNSDSNGENDGGTISPDGQVVVFYSYASNLVSGDNNNVADIFVRDARLGLTQRVSVSTGGAQANGPSGNCGRSADLDASGRFVAFCSYASNLVSADYSGVRDIFVHDRRTGVTSRVSIDSMGDESNGDSSSPVISDDGEFSAFASIGSNLVAGDTNLCNSPLGQVSCDDVFLHDLGDSDNDYEWDPFDPCPTNPDCDADGFGDGVELYVGTNPLVACGVDAWPADVNNDGYSDISDVIPLLNYFGRAVPPAPVRHNIAPDPPDGYVDITDVVRMVNFFGKGCV